jgi:hypothetical protein
MVGREYAILKEDMKLDECGWSKNFLLQYLQSAGRYYNIFMDK